MPQDDMPDGSTGDWAADKVLRALIGSAMRMPYDKRVPFMGAVLRRVIGPLAGYRRRAKQNLQMVYPRMTTPARRELADQVCDNFGRTLIENYSWQELGQRLADTELQGDGLAALETARDEKRAVIFVTGHFANHEVPRHLLTARGYEIGGLYRPMGNPYFNDHYAKTMTSWGGPVFEQGRRGTAGFARHLKAGGMATLLFDVASSHGTPIPFLGHDAKTLTSAADLALRTDALVLPYFAVRRPDGLNFDVYLESPIAHGDPIAMTTAMTARLEARIAAHPEQWFWVHRRWK
ncbi:lysophospholipid acyltransferase family protein [Yoonia sp. 208BN28-4]|uniref:lysophospholipid acyltransferase family protein n=1 Tax=Yoonia sp. 208BN28-4 TaxID=3126505 RepID=UPI0030A77055